MAKVMLPLLLFINFPDNGDMGHFAGSGQKGAQVPFDDDRNVYVR